MNNDILFKDLKKYKKQSLYKIARLKGEQRKNLGYNYTETLMDKTLSGHTTRNSTIDGFLTFITDYFVNLIKAVKWVQIHRVYTVDKDYEYID
jgi:hypothetical protein